MFEEDAGLHLSLAFQSVIVVTLPTATDAEARCSAVTHS